MGTFSVRLEVGDPLGHRFEAIDPVNRRLIPVDALLLPATVARRAGGATQSRPSAAV